MHFVMLSDQETMGGAAIAASRLATALVAAGHRVTRIVATPSGRHHPWTTLPVPAWTWLYRVLRRALPVAGREALDRRNAEQWLAKTLDQLRPDILNLHNLHGARLGGWSPHLAAICLEQAPTLWTLHDMWSFTGRCAYNGDCRRFVTGCTADCPTAHEYPALAPNRIAGAYAARQALYNACPDLVAVAPSRWLAAEAQAGLWCGRRVEVIPYGLPLDVFAPMDRAAARAALGVRPCGPVLLVVAQRLDDPRKGGALLAQALRGCRPRPLTVLTLGSGTLPLHEPDIAQIALGFVQDEQTMVCAYNAADVFVHPARQDNLPNVVLESIACGTPVVGLPIGGVPDIVRTDETGWLAAKADADALTEALENALTFIRDQGDLRASCRRIAESEYAAPLQAARYAALGKEMIACRAVP